MGNRTAIQAGDSIPHFRNGHRLVFRRSIVIIAALTIQSKNVSFLSVFGNALHAHRLWLHFAFTNSGHLEQCSCRMAAISSSLRIGEPAFCQSIVGVVYVLTRAITGSQSEW